MPIRTAPSVDGSPTYKRLSIKMVDHTGDSRAVSVRVASDITPAEAEAVVAAVQALSNASAYGVELIDVYAGAKSAGNADASVYLSVYDNLVLNLKNIGTGAQQSVFVPAVLESVIEDGDTPDITDPLVIAVRDAYVAAAGAGYTAATFRFTERRDKNDAVSAT